MFTTSLGLVVHFPHSVLPFSSIQSANTKGCYVLRMVTGSSENNSNNYFAVDTESMFNA